MFGRISIILSELNAIVNGFMGLYGSEMGSSEPEICDRRSLVSFFMPKIRQAINRQQKLCALYDSNEIRPGIRKTSLRNITLNKTNFKTTPFCLKLIFSTLNAS